MIEKALRVDPRRARNVTFFEYLAIGNFLSENHALALEWAQKSAQRTGYLPYLRILLAIFHASLEQPEKAQAQVREVLQVAPDASIATIKRPPLKNETDLKRYLDGLRKASFPK